MCLAILDVAVGRAFRMPSDPAQEPSTLQRYFEYGRSVEGKLRWMAGTDGQSGAPIMRAGWLREECGARPDDSPSRQMDFYGMSFSQQIADQMVAQDPSLKVSILGGPGAPLNHSYACFLGRLDAAKAQMAPIQVIGVLASSVRRVVTVSGLSTSFEAPQPFTYPRFTLDAGGALASYQPSVKTEQDLRQALQAPERWSAFLGELEAHDRFYSGFVTRADVLDRSVLGRMLRRAVGQRLVRDRTEALRPESGFDGDGDLPRLLGKILVDFGDRSRQAQMRPFVILIEDRGLGLTSAVAAQLKAHQIAYLATSEIVSSNDSSNFLPDGHFVPDANRQIARAVFARLGLTPPGSAGLPSASAAADSGSAH